MVLEAGDSVGHAVRQWSHVRMSSPWSYNVDKAADLAMARTIVLNAKMRRTGVCGAAETLLIDRAAAPTMLQPLVAMLLDAGCEVRGDADVQKSDTRVKPASEEDWPTEYLDSIIAAKVVDGVDAAIAHIERYGSHHTDAIVTADQNAAEKFLSEVDSAIVLMGISFGSAGRRILSERVGEARWLASHAPARGFAQDSDQAPPSPPTPKRRQAAALHRGGELSRWRIR